MDATEPTQDRERERRRTGTTAPPPTSPVARAVYGLTTLAMRPFMRAWAHTIDEQQTTLPRATDAPVARGSGPDPDRILLLGNDFGVSAAVRTHDLALTGQVARALAAATGRGTDVEARTDPDVSLETMHGLLEGARLWRYDAIVVLCGVSDAARLTSERRWRRSLGRLLDDVIEQSAMSTQIVVMGTQPLHSVSSFTGRLAARADRHARVLNAATESVCESRPGVLYRRLPAPSGPPRRLGTRGALIFNEWADAIAAALAPRLSAGPPDAGAARSLRDRPEPEEERQQAVDAMGLLPGTASERLNRITELARNLYRTNLATITVLDHDRQVHYSKVGMDRDELPRADSVCDHTIRGDGASIYGDLWQDEHFKTIESLRDDPPIRFYAGYPIESPDGYRIGSLCVMDGEPRDASQVDPAPLRDLAMLVQKQLWAERAG